ncbi:uncharacterized protein EI90DRAFT_3029389 [Cantharellus anzutake]|uniref:uncharacterized protein n=1 Tax=Cantharellus anzutake TaxID=1750568 RepID=UPI001908D925|nr:uncharacterized protein EI90DRAFT_3057318 [Cantharellus anzutake]XP_038922997.1 uncharacterized protein EI90DRAFT_3029389 [Cantharellus anzutake]KAF8331271.1 hypothetical protein EI90DRAFT_3057318 [Cantharellus anzutake]KAF8342552.1 hypothetical protein EI90DRAFT_3029389 [Cantharellus anzutake]
MQMWVNIPSPLRSTKSTFPFPKDAQAVATVIRCSYNQVNSTWSCEKEHAPFMTC